MDDAFFVGINNVGREQDPVCDVSADLSCHIVTLNAVYGRVLVGIFLLDFLVVTFNKGKYLVVGGVCLSDKIPCVTVLYISPCKVKCTLGHYLVFHHILDLFHRYSSAHFVALVFNILSDILDLFLGQIVLLLCLICF